MLALLAILAVTAAEQEDPLLAPPPRASRELKSWDEARQLMHERSTELKTAALGIDRAQGVWRQSLAALLPTARGSLSIAHDLLNPDNAVLATGGGGTATIPRGGEGQQPTTPLGAGNLSLTQSVFDLSAWRGLAGAKAAQEGAEESYADTERRVSQGLARTLVAVVAAERVAEINRIGLRQALERQSLTQRRFELGGTTELDVVRISQDTAVARAALISGDEQLFRTREALAIALGTAGEIGISRDFSLVGLVEQTKQTCRVLAGDEKRADVLAAEAQVRAAEKRKEQASAGYLPTVGVSSSVFSYTTDPDFARVASWSISAVLAFPIWEGGLREGLVKEREALARQAEETAEATRRTTAIEIARSRRGENVAQKLVDAALDARDLAQKTDQMTRRSFEIGRATSFELVQSATVLRQAELNLALREFELVQARLDAFLTEARCNNG